MKAEVLYAATDGTHDKHCYEAAHVTMQVWGNGCGSMKLYSDDGEFTGSALYSNVVYMRRGNAVPITPDTAEAVTADMPKKHA